MTRRLANRWLRRAGLGVIILSGSAALPILLLPVVLVLLLALFDTMAHALLVLLGQVLALLPEFAPTGGAAALSPYQSIMDDPGDAAWESLVRALPCLAGLMLIQWSRQAWRWWAIVLVWSLTARLNGELVAALLLPGIVVAGLFAMPTITARGGQNSGMRK